MVDQGLNGLSGLRLWRIAAIVADVLAIVLLLTQGLLRGLTELLRDVLVAIGLPFAILFGMAGWRDRLLAMTQVAGGFDASGAAPLWLVGPILGGCVSLVAAGIAQGGARRAWFGLSGLLNVAVAIGGGFPLMLMMVPGVIAAILGVVKDSVPDGGR